MNSSLPLVNEGRYVMSGCFPLPYSGKICFWRGGDYYGETDKGELAVELSLRHISAWFSASGGNNPIKKPMSGDELGCSFAKLLFFRFLLLGK